MKKISILSGLLCISLSIAACGNKEDKPDKPADQNNQQNNQQNNHNDANTESSDASSDKNDSQSDISEESNFVFETKSSSGVYTMDSENELYVLDQYNYTTGVNEYFQADTYPYNTLNIVIQSDKPISGTYELGPTPSAQTYVGFYQYSLDEDEYEQAVRFYSASGQIIVNSLADGTSKITLKNVVMKQTDYDPDEIEEFFIDTDAFTINYFTIENNEISLLDCSDVEHLDAQGKYECGIWDEEYY